MRQRKTLPNDQRINPRRRYNNYKYIYAPNIGAGEGDGTPLQHSCLENPMDGGAW